MHTQGLTGRGRALATVIITMALVAVTMTAVSAFDDVPPGSFFDDAVDWMDDQDITKGRTPTEFDPYATVTRAELITFIWRFAGQPAADPSTFTDAGLTPFAATALGWAQDIELTTGRTPTTFDPNATSTRAEVVTLLWRFMCRPDKASPHGFSDVIPGSFYEDAVGWAKAAAITGGKTPTLFDPNGTTQRSEAATFLHRLAGEPAIGDPGDNRSTFLPTCDDGDADPVDGDEGSSGAPAFTAVGNTQLRVTGGAAAATGLVSAITSTTNLLDNASDADGDNIAVDAATGASTAQGGTVDLYADGTFRYVSAAGFTGVDSFSYTVCDDSLLPGCVNSTAYLTVADTVFYVDKDTGSDGSGDGTSVAPFASLAPLTTGGTADGNDGTGDTIYVLEPSSGNIAGGIVLEDNQKLLGQGVDLVIGATTLISASANPTIASVTGTGITLGLDNTVRGVDVDTRGGPGKGIDGSSTGDLVISDVDNVMADVNWAVDLTGTGSPDVTIGHASSTLNGAVKLFNHQSGSSFTFTNVTSGGADNHGVNIFGFFQAGSTVDLGTVSIAKTGDANDGIHVVNSRGAVVSTTAGTVATQGVGVYVQNAGAVINGLTINGDPAGKEGINVTVTDLVVPIDVAITGNTIGVGTAIALDEILVDVSTGATVCTDITFNSFPTGAIADLTAAVGATLNTPASEAAMESANINLDVVPTGTVGFGGCV